MPCRSPSQPSGTRPSASRRSASMRTHRWSPSGSGRPTPPSASSSSASPPPPCTSAWKRRTSSGSSRRVVSAAVSTTTIMGTTLRSRRPQRRPPLPTAATPRGRRPDDGTETDMGDADRLDGRVLVITGGASGIGSATARRLVDHGARVVLGDVDVDGLREAERELGDACASVEVDVRREADVERLVAYAVEHFGGIDGAVACAGVGGFGPLVDTPVEEWTRVVDTNLTGSFLTLKHTAAALVRSNRPGVVVLV